jgi:hypothetical protein
MDGPPLAANAGAGAKVPKNTELPQVRRNVAGTVKILTAAEHIEVAEMDEAVRIAELSQAEAGAVNTLAVMLSEKHCSASVRHNADVIKGNTAAPVLEPQPKVNVEIALLAAVMANTVTRPLEVIKSDAEKVPDAKPPLPEQVCTTV